MGLSIGQIEKTTGDREMVERAKLAIGSLEKQTFTPGSLPLEVILLLDISGSMQDEYEDGLVERMVRRALAFAATVDNDAEVQVVGFGRNAYVLPPINLKNYNDYFGGRGGGLFGRRRQQWWPNLEPATYLGKGMQLALEVAAQQLGNPQIAELAYRGNPQGCKSSKGVFVINVTDGEPHDGHVAMETQRNSADALTFWSHLYCSNQAGGWNFLEGLNNLGGRRVDNSNAARFPNIDAVTDKIFYEKVTADFGPWSRFAQNPNNGLYQPN